MFRNMGRRGIAVGALVLSLSATTFGGAASAAPLADDTKSCSVAAQARNESVHVLHDAWKSFRDQLKDLAHDARGLEHEANKAGHEATLDARAAIASAREELSGIWETAHEDIQGLVDLGAACKDSEADEDSATKTTTTTTTTTTTSTTLDTSGLDAKYKTVVDQAIKDMQKVVDDLKTVITNMTTAAQTASTADAAKAKAQSDKAKELRAKDKETRKHGALNRAKGEGQDSTDK